MTDKQINKSMSQAFTGAFLGSVVVRFFVVPFVVMLLLGAATPWALGFWQVFGILWLARIITNHLGFSFASGRRQSDRLNETASVINRHKYAGTPYERLFK